MGCDIHFHRLYTVLVEPDKEPSEVDFDVMVRGLCRFDQLGVWSIAEVNWSRSYSAFAILADIRNDWGFVPLNHERIDYNETYPWDGGDTFGLTRLRLSDFVATPEYWDQTSPRDDNGDSYARVAGWYYSHLLPAIVAECERQSYALDRTYLEYMFDS